MTYRDWLKRVDFWLLDRASITHNDVSDYEFRSAYESGHSPKRAAIEALFDVDLEELMNEEKLNQIAASIGLHDEDPYAKDA